jgi:hypothetical protein
VKKADDEMRIIILKPVEKNSGTNDENRGWHGLSQKPNSV